MAGALGHAVQPRLHGRVVLQRDATLGGDVDIAVQGDVGDRVPLADQEAVTAQMAFQRGQRPARRAASLASRTSSATVIPAIVQNRSTARLGSTSYCSKNIHCSTWARSKPSEGRYSVPSAK